MCGIVGSVGGDRPGGAAFVAQATEHLRHRGPDASGTQHFPRCSLGHTRLRILDLTPSGDQPMGNEAGTVSVVFNGEIYNFGELRAEFEAGGHRFHSTTDTEVLVHLYEKHGEALARRLRGMFAFAVWDEAAGRLVLCRDRLGIKPLYYRIDGGSLAFASEARTIARGSDVLDVESLAAYLRLGWVPGPKTIWTGITELLPGHTLVWEGGATRVEAYWSPSPDDACGDACGDAVPEVEALSVALVDAARRHLVADVPVGLFLSSGVDSAVVGSLARRVAPSVRAFTVAGDWADESVAATKLAGRLGLEHEVVPVEGRVVRASLDRFFGAMDQPTVDGLNTWVIAGAVRDAGLVVALSGLGGDELFGGYSTFRHVPRLMKAGRAVRRLPAWVASAPEATLARSERTAHSRARRASEALTTGRWGTAYASVRGLFGARELSRIWPAGTAPLPSMVSEPENSRGSLAMVSGLELANYLPFQLLRDTDVMSMAHGLEVRVPLLDDDIIALALARQRAAGPMWQKSTLVHSVDPQLADLPRQAKRTFTLPIGEWMKGPLRDEAFGALVELGEAGIGFDRRQLTALWDGHRAGSVGWRSVWGLVALAGWLRSSRAGLEARKAA